MKHLRSAALLSLAVACAAPAAATGRGHEASFDELIREGVEERLSLLPRHDEVDDLRDTLRGRLDERRAAWAPWAWQDGLRHRDHDDWRDLFDRHLGGHGGHGGDFPWRPGDEPYCLPVPEPASASLMLAGLAALGVVARRRRR